MRKRSGKRAEKRAGNGNGVSAEQHLWALGVKERLFAAWTSNGFTQNGFARAIDRTSSSISVRMKSGSLEHWWDLVKIARVLEVSTDSLLGIEPPHPSMVRPTQPAGVVDVEEVVAALHEALGRAEELRKRLSAQESAASRKI